MHTNTLEQWQAEEAAVRSKLAKPGVVSLAELKSKSGLDFFASIFNGENPSVPIGHHFDFVPISVEQGRVVFQGTPRREYYNPLGSVHGGYFCTLLDSAVGCAVHTTLPAGMGYTTLELKVNFIRPLTDKTGPVRTEGKVIHSGARSAIAEGRIVDVNNKLYAHATTTCMVFPL